MTINKGVRIVIRDKTYFMKFLKNDQMITRIIIQLMKSGYVQTPMVLKQKDFKVHMQKHMYRAYSQIGHNSQSFMRKYYMGKKIKK